MQIVTLVIPEIPLDCLKAKTFLKSLNDKLVKSNAPHNEFAAIICGKFLGSQSDNAVWLSDKRKALEFTSCANVCRYLDRASYAPGFRPSALITEAAETYVRYLTTHEIAARSAPNIKIIILDFRHSGSAFSGPEFNNFIEKVTNITNNCYVSFVACYEDIAAAYSRLLRGFNTQKLPINDLTSEQSVDGALAYLIAAQGAVQNV